MSHRLLPGLLFLLATSPLFAAGPTGVTELAPADLARLNRGRVLVQRYLPDEASRKLYQTVPGKLGTLRAIMKIEAVTASRRDLLEALGVVMGDTFVQDMGFRWVAVESASGRHVAIRYRRTNVFLYPLTMIAERVQRGEKTDARDLYNAVAADVEEQIDD
jgi:Domain of unknown function (DUF3806)